MQLPPSENRPLASAHSLAVVSESQVSYVSEDPCPSMTDVELVAVWMQDPEGSLSQAVARKGRTNNPPATTNRLANDLIVALQSCSAGRCCIRQAKRPLRCFGAADQSITASANPMT